MSTTSAAVDASHWLLLIHQIPPKPAYFRAKVGRRLARLGAVAIKNSVYAMPSSEQAREDLQWLAREIATEGGEATLCTASLVEGLRDEQVEALFHTARDADYAQVAEEGRQLVRDTPSKLGRHDERRPLLEADLARLRKRIIEIVAIDFFGSSGREAAESATNALEKRLRSGAQKKPADAPSKPDRADYQGRTWVTRKNVHVDRIACAWLIRRFIDDRPTFSFVAAQGHEAKPDEVSFDMFEATFTHIGERCSFEVLIEQFELREPGLSVLAEIIHDIDVKDGKYARAETPGIAALIAGIALAHREDEARIALGSSAFDALLELYRRKRSRTAAEGT